MNRIVLLVVAVLITFISKLHAFSSCIVIPTKQTAINNFELRKVSINLIRPFSESISRTNLSASFKSLVAGDKIFRVHSVFAGLFGSLLLTFPSLISQNFGTMDAYQKWSIFIIAVSYITFNAPDFEPKSKLILARTYFMMCLVECILFINSIRVYLPIEFNLYDLSILFTSAIIFGGLAYGYLVSGSLGFDIPTIALPAAIPKLELPKFEIPTPLSKLQIPKFEIPKFEVPKLEIPGKKKGLATKEEKIPSDQD